MPVQSLDIQAAIQNPLNLSRIAGLPTVDPTQTLTLIHDVCQGGFARTIYEDYYLSTLDIAAGNVSQTFLDETQVQRPIFFAATLNDTVNVSVELRLKSPRTGLVHQFSRQDPPFGNSYVIYNFPTQFIVATGYELQATFIGGGAGDTADLFCFYGKTEIACEVAL